MDPTSPASPPLSPALGNAAFAKTISRPQSAGGNIAVPRSKRSSSRATESHVHVSRRSDEDMKTAVKVAVRVRPPLKPSDPGFDLIPQRFRESTCNVPTTSSLSIQSPQGKKLFVFDRVFDEDTSQGGVWDYLSESITAFIKGYNVSVLAYGQSGAGKSYTMGTSGPDDQSDTEVMGIIPRAAQALFEQLNGPSIRSPSSGIQHPKRYSTQNLPHLAPTKNAGGNTWELKATYMEIYNEQLRDLLVPENTPQAERQQVSIREDTKGRILLTGLTQVSINSVEDLLQALNFGSSIRQTDETAINARSSRSHAVFSLNLVQKKPEPVTSPMSKAEKRRSTPVETLSADNTMTTDSKLHFVDLAGSERLKNTNAKGERAKEGISINAGLASLGKVISQLSSKNGHTHISYRDSRLTRLLQDSLGGNAVTYMVACVTPAAFHLNETLNTVHYAQRARAIQSKPEIQTSYEDGDKQAIIERLRAEVSFLRDQVRHAETTDRKGAVGSDRNQARGREELESQLLDMQENYNALSQRHTKLVSDLSKARENDATDAPELSESISDNALERVKRSSSFAEAVELMVVEYEKTIQSLESSLSKTRSTLASAETDIVDKDTHINYLENLQQQLETRVQKAMHREQSAETYLRNLETKIEGATSDEERTATHITELRKELARLRESETSAEEYISTLEERLAEAEQDQEIMQREIDRLEHVVERQRSIGRLDNILGELDASHEEARHPADPALQKPKMNGHRYQDSYDPFRPMDESMSTADERSIAGDDDASMAPSKTSIHSVHPNAHSPAQNDFMADKVENLTQELFDLRSEHEANIVDYENLQQKYRTALETLAKLEYQREAKESRSEPRDSGHASFLADAGMREEEKAEQREQPSSSRSLSADLSSRGPLSIAGEDDKEQRGSETDETAVTEDTLVQGDEVPPTPETAVSMQAEMDMLHKLHTEKDVSLTELTHTYKSLANRHEATLRQVENLKREVQMNQLRPASPGLVKPKTNRRKSEDLLGIGGERVTRSLNSLKAIAFDHFDSSPDVRQNFELSLNSVMNELNSRSERVAALEVELTAVRKEMEGKSAIIAGLTRERSSLRASSPVDFSVVGQMRDQLMESENQIRALHEQHAARERELKDEISSLKEVVASRTEAAVPGSFPQTPAEVGEEPSALDAGQDKQEISRLQSELATWETKHATAISSMKASEANLLKTISDLEASMRRSASSPLSTELSHEIGTSRDVASSDFEEERAQHMKTVEILQKEVEEHKTTADTHRAKFEELEQSYGEILKQVDGGIRADDVTAKELQMHKEMVGSLENQLKEHQTAVRNHQTSLDILQDTHDKELDLLKSSLKHNEEEYRKHQADMSEHHDLVVENLQADLSSVQAELDQVLKNATLGLGYKTDPVNIKDHIRGLVEEGKEVHARHIKTNDELKMVQEELQNALTNTVDLESRVNELKMMNDDMIVNLEKVAAREKKSARLVEDLEEQLNSTFDQQRSSTRRMSSMHTEAVEVRMALERELEEQKLKNNSLETQIAALQRQSIASNASNFNRDSLSPEAAAIALAKSGLVDPTLSTSAPQRKSVGGSILPTPPPSIPLPPLPGTPSANVFPSAGFRSASPVEQRPSSSSHTNSPPGSRHNSKESPAAITQLVEEQEARIRTIEKHLFAEKQLTATLEEALVDLETSANRTKADMETWRKKCGTLEDEIVTLRKDKSSQRASLQAVEEEREMRVRAEKARQALEQRMAELNAGKKKKKNALNCF